MTANKIMRAALLGSAAATALLIHAQPGWAQEQTAMTNMQKGMKVSFGGFINKAMLWADDGKTSRTMVVDNSTESSRFTIAAEGAITEDLKFGAVIEYEMNSNAATAVTLQGNGDFNQGSANFSERVAEVFIDHERFGKFSLGQGHTASDEIIEMDLSGTQFSANNAKASEIGNSILFFNSTTRTTAGSPTVGEAMNPLNGLDLADRVRYDTPKFLGFVASTSFVSGGGADVTLRHEGKYGPFEVVAGFGYFNQSGTNTSIDHAWSGSGSVLHESGLNLTVAGGRRNLKDQSRSDPHYVYGKLGYIAKIFNVGTTNFGIDYGTFDDFARNGDEAKVYSIGIVQHFKNIGSAIYVLGKNYSLDRSGSSFDDVKVVMTGLKVNF